MRMKKKYLLTASTLLLSTVALAACGKSSSSSESSQSSTYSYVYTTDPDSLNYIRTANDATASITTQAVDGLLTNDKYGNLVGALAKDWTVSKDGLTYTYKLRKDAKWYTSDGEEYADVTAQDFVTGLKYAADQQADALYIIQDSVKGLKDYLDGKTKDFSTVGVKALDDHTVQYTLTKPESFWNSKTTYGILAPVNAEFLKTQGKKFGTADPSTILYNGPFIIASLTSKSSIELEKNEHYYDADKVKLDKIQLTYFDGSDTDSLYHNFADGTYSEARLFPNKPSFKTVQKENGENIYYTPQDAGVYFASFNLDRQAYEFTDKKDDKAKADTREAILNKNFRQSIVFAFDRTKYTAQSVGEEAASKKIRNLFTPPTFVSAGGKTFGDMVKEELKTLNSPWADVDLSDGKDTLFNADKAKESFAKAKEELTAKGVSFPIHLDVVMDQSAEVPLQQVASLKQSLESNLGKDNVVVDVHKLNVDDYHRVSYLVESAAQQDWDISVTLGWNPDYQDPSSYLDIFNVKDGSEPKVIGLDRGSTSPAVAASGMDKYSELDSIADNSSDDLVSRYQAFAKVQANLTDNAFIIPTYSSGAIPKLSRVVPFSGAYALTGSKGSANTTLPYMKDVVLQDKPVSAAEYEKAYKKWLSDKEKADADYQKELEKHIEK